MGLASGIGTGVAVFSSYRPHGYGQLFSVMLHELGHAQGLRHCPNIKCMMQNAKGGNPFSKTNVFCDKWEAQEYGIITLQMYIDEACHIMFSHLRKLLDEGTPLHEIPQLMKELNVPQNQYYRLNQFNYNNFYYL